MPCLNPSQGYRAKKVNPSGKRSIVYNRNEGFVDLPVTIPCGWCRWCRLEHSRQNAIRCHHEAQMYKENCFITLTYNSEFLPYRGTLVKAHLQKFMKRLQRKYGEGIRQFHCGEYGEKKGRPHYHICVFNHDFKDKKIWKEHRGHTYYTSQELQSLWSDPKTKRPFGNAIVANMTFQTAAYVARYVCKKAKGKNSLSHYERVDPETGEIYHLLPEFGRGSAGKLGAIGKPWLDKYHRDVYPHDEVVINGKPMKPPKYYDLKFEQLFPDEMEIIKSERRKAAKLHAHDNTFDRLRVKEEILERKFQQLKRSYEND